MSLFNWFNRGNSMEHSTQGEFYDETEALPLPAVVYIGIGDIVRYERLNDAGEVVMFAYGRVTKINYRTNEVRLHAASGINFWTHISTVSLVAANAALSAEFAA